MEQVSVSVVMLYYAQFKEYSSCAVSKLHNS